MYSIKDAIDALRKGEIILIFDGEGREEETDIVVASQFITPEIVRTMRQDGGGLICTSVHPKIAEDLGIPFITDVYKKAWAEFPTLKHLEANDIPYDEKSSFSITINHRKTFTGITDNDRALTIKEFCELSQNGCCTPEKFGENFRCPGHVVLLRAADGLLETRQGHTELSVALIEAAGLVPVTTICEMMGEDGTSMSLEDTREYALKNNLVILEGRQIMGELKSMEIQKKL